MITSFIIFITTELLLGGLIGEFVVGRYMSINLRLMMQGLLQLSSFFIGGIIIGVISPGVRIYEPAVGAFLSIATMLVITLLTPISFIHFSLTKVIVGGGIAFFLALSGAKIGERLMGNKV
jgi:hypothetical protein